MRDQRGQLPMAVVRFAGCAMRSYDRARSDLRTWLDSWSGVGHVAVGMHRQGFDLQFDSVRRARPSARRLREGHGATLKQVFRDEAVRGQDPAVDLAGHYYWTLRVVVRR
jgi:hypothetical protein